MNKRIRVCTLGYGGVFITIQTLFKDQVKRHDFLLRLWLIFSRILFPPKKKREEENENEKQKS